MIRHSPRLDSTGLEVPMDVKPPPSPFRDKGGEYRPNVTIYLCFYPNPPSFMEGRNCHSIDSNQLYHIYPMTN
jgi:hypothetical protein